MKTQCISACLAIFVTCAAHAAPRFNASEEVVENPGITGIVSQFATTDLSGCGCDENKPK